MAQFELSISPNYVPDWTAVDAVREIFQNALDQQTTNPENKMGWNFSKEDDCFIISSKDSRLTKDTLLFGSSTKADDVKTIGMFGEGYKLAMLVLTRLGHKVTIYNNAEDEIWRPRLINSRRFKSKLLVVDVEKLRFAKKSDNKLTFVIEYVDAGLIADIGMSNLHMKKPDKFFETSYGRVLQDERHVGKVFINGLYVATVNGFNFGYDAKPEFLTIGRDRNLISDFNLSWLTSRMWAESELHGISYGMVKEDAPDTIYIRNFTSKDGEFAKTVYADFVGTYGKMAIPVSSQEEFDIVKRDYKKLKPIIVKENVRVILESSTAETKKKDTKKRDTRLPNEILESLFKKCTKHLPSELDNEFNRIIKQSYNWTFK